MKENKLGLKTLFFVVTVLIFTCGIVYAQPPPPPIPSDYSGYVTVNGEPAPDGALVYAKIGGYTSNSVPVSDGGRYRYLLVAPPDSTYKDKTIEFYVDPDAGGPIAAALADETGIFDLLGNSHDLDLTVVIVDSTPPLITNISHSGVTTSGATITWITDEPSTSLVEYGETTSYGSLTALDPAMETSHSVKLTGLAAGKTYHFRVVSADEAGNTAHSTDRTFTTASPSSPPVVVYPSQPSNKPPVADAGPDRTVYVNVAIHLSGAGSRDPDGAIEQYDWSFGDGDQGSGVKVKHVYVEAGIYIASLQVTDDDGETSTDNCTVTVQPVPAPLEAKIFDEVPADQTGYVVDASFGADITVTVDTTGPVSVTVIKYESNPHPEDPMPDGGVPKYADIFVSDPDAVDWPIYVEMTYTDEEIEGLDENSLGMYYWKDGGWHRCSDTGVDTERNVVWAYMTREEASGSPVLIGGTPLSSTTRPAEFEFSNFTVEPAEPLLGEAVYVSLRVTNIGEEAGNRTVTLNVGEGLIIMEKTVALEGGESETLVFEVHPETEGIYSLDVEGLVGGFEVQLYAEPEPAEFTASDLSITPVEVEEGGEVTITVKISNVGEEEGSHFLELLLNGSVADSETVTLAGGATTTVSFAVMKEAGTYAVSIEGLSGGFIVTAPVEPPVEPPPQESFPWTYVAAAGVVAVIVIALIARKYMG